MNFFRNLFGKAQEDEMAWVKRPTKRAPDWRVTPTIGRLSVNRMRR
jgi:hypothetical protein